MSHETTMRRAYELISAGEIDAFAEHLADDFVEHEELPGLEQSKEGVRQLFHMYRAAFPDLRMEPEDVLVSGDKAVARVRATGTHEGEFMGRPPTNKEVAVAVIDICRFEEGKMIEHWGVPDRFHLMVQLGFVPMPPGTRA